MIIKMTSFQEGVYQYYLEYTKNKTNYVPLEQKRFERIFIEECITFFLEEQNQILGLIALKQVEQIGYITILFGEEDKETKLLNHLEDESTQLGIKELWIHFLNPMLLPWYPIEDMMHPGKPGIDVDWKEFDLYKRFGFFINSIQEVYYLDLADFKSKNLLYPSKQYEIDYYDSKKHQGYARFAEEIGSEYWKKMLLDNLDMDHQLPMLVALDNQSVIGFTGPLKVMQDGRGYFAGIGILKEYRGNKLGKYLFNNLCMQLKLMGAKYMTLYTGETNPAKYIYGNAGFSVGRRCATMKKIL